MEPSHALALSFRWATAADVPALVALVESAYRGESSRTGWTTEADLLEGQRTDAEAVRAVLDDPRGHILAAEREGELVACCQLERPDSAPEARSTQAYFGMFAVRPAAQAGGVGRKVLAEAEDVAVRRWAATEMVMTVLDARAELIAWYERRGYQRTGQHRPFPYGEERFGLPRRADLRFAVLVKKLS